MNVKPISPFDLSLSATVMLHSEPHRSLQRESYCWSLVVGLRKSLWSSENVTNAQSRRRKLVEEGDEEEGV